MKANKNYIEQTKTILTYFASKIRRIIAKMPSNIPLKLDYVLFIYSYLEFAMANVTCEYDSGSNNGTASTGQPPAGANANGRRVRRSETLLSQAADFVSNGQTFQTVSDMFNIPISTIR